MRQGSRVPLLRVTLHRAANGEIVEDSVQCGAADRQDIAGMAKALRDLADDLEVDEHVDAPGA